MSRLILSTLILPVNGCDVYKLTARMVQHFKSDLGKYHDLFDGGRCSSWELEELIVRAIKSDTQAQHQVFWREAGHDDKEDINIDVGGVSHKVQVKSGRESGGKLRLSGHRLGRFQGDLHAITDYLNTAGANFITVPYQKVEDDTGRHHKYTICYIDVENMRGLEVNKWEEHGKQHRQTNEKGVEFSLRPSMSWQIWWGIPLDLVERGRELQIT